MKISIALASFNGEKYIEEQLESFLYQTRIPDELIISDDHSNDSTFDIIKNYAKKAPFEVIYSQNNKNVGYSANFNEAINKTSGDLVLLSDQDDVWFKDKIEIVEKVAIKTDNLLIVNDKIITDQNLNSLSSTSFKKNKINKTLNKYIHGSYMSIKRELLNYCLPIPSEYVSHDVWINHFAVSMNSIEVIERSLQYYRRHEDATMIKRNKSRNNNIERDNKHVKKIKEYEKLIYVLSGIRKNEKIYEKNIKKYIDNIKILKSIEERRFNIRNKVKIIRMYHIYKIWLEGGYSKTNGIKSILYDIKY